LISAAGVPRPVSVVPVAAGALARQAGGELVGPDSQISGITASSGHVHPGDVFVALPGRTAHGISFAPEAVARGAAAVLTDRDGVSGVPPGTPAIVVGDVRRVLGPISATVYGDPSRHLRMLGITGTSGKTTTTYLMRAGLQAAGRVPGLIGTVATIVGDDTIETGFTTPEAPEVHALLAVMRERGVTDVAMEVSSHALEFGRVGGVEFDIGGFTNLSEEHLDVHGDMAHYFAAKRRLFAPGVWPVIVIDDEWGNRMADLVGPCTTVSTVPNGRATWRVSGAIEEVPGVGSRFLARARLGEDVRLQREVDVVAGCAIPGRFNVANALLALAMLEHAGIDPEVAAPAVATATVPGRMERVEAGQPFLAVVDYSHKPAAVDGAIRALRPLTRGRLIVVLGCGGDRDRSKRPVMGEIAARGADLLIVTDDNPRSEPPAAIRQAMLAGALAVPAADRGEVREIGDRAEAIEAAVRAAAAGDTVLVAGKGHETGQEIAGVVHPFDDRVVLQDALHERFGAGIA
jgi:UDP-N-acetylmuramoyl-L-alanyl-D-glutamate--2,6-diaminopimelate ligase